MTPFSDQDLLHSVRHRTTEWINLGASPDVVSRYEKVLVRLTIASIEYDRVVAIIEAEPDRKAKMILEADARVISADVHRFCEQAETMIALLDMQISLRHIQ
jgi:hypothetical protein